MDLETHRKIYKIKQDSYKNYVNEKIKGLEVLSEDDINNVLDIINEDYNKEKNNIIEETKELFYNHKKI